jgi:CRISPR/Cas system-associated endonuclease Cas1
VAAKQTVVESPRSCKLSSMIDPLVPRHGVLTLFGFGIRVFVDRGHLSIEDGVGTDRRQLRLPRVGHGLRRLVVIGNDGMISLDALRWLADQNAAFVMLERNGKVLTTTGPVRSSDARLRRAQALANESGAALQIARELMTQKLAAQERLVRHQLQRPMIADAINRDIDQLSRAESIDTVRMLESRSAKAYWSAWADIRIEFPRNDVKRVMYVLLVTASYVAANPQPPTRPYPTTRAKQARERGWD